MQAPDHAKPSVSVVVPVWDRYAGPLLDEALDSLLAEGSAAELIVVDNASTTPVSPKDASVKVVRTGTRLTCGGARNFGLRSVTSPLVVMWDADDVIFPGTLSYLQRKLDADPRLVAHAAGIVESPSGVRHRWPRRWVSTLTRWPSLFALVNSIWSQYPTTGATMMRTDVVREAGGYREVDSGDDWSLGVALLWRGAVGWSERPGRHYRQHEHSLWAGCSTIEHLLEHARAVRTGLRRDHAAPSWCRRILPLIQLAQYAAIFVVRPVIGRVRRTG